jgi:PAS domain S-box-containing protein
VNLRPNKPPRVPRWWFPAAVLLAGLSLTLFASLYVSQTLNLRSRAQFDSSSEHMRVAVHAQLDTYVALLRGLAGYFAAETNVTREVFKAYIDRLRLGTDYPGIQGLGFALRTPSFATNAVRMNMRNQGVTNFQIWPAFARPEYFPILYLEPENVRNRAAIGYDMYTDPVRRAAMNQARDSGHRAASGKVILVQEIEGIKQAGFLIYLPIYEDGRIPETIDERRLKLKGFVYAPFRLGDLLTALFNPELLHGMDVQVFDGNGTGPEDLLFSSTAESSGRPGFTTTHEADIPIDVVGRIWTVHLRERSAHEGAFWFVPLLSVGGVGLSFTLFYLTYSEARARRRAERSTAQLQASEQALRDSETWLRLILENAWDYAIFSLDMEGRVISWNTGAERMFGFSEEEIVGQQGAVIFTDRDRERGAPEEELNRASRDGMAWDDCWHQRKNRSQIFVSGVVRPIVDGSGKQIGFIKIARDVTERLQAQEQLRHEKEFSDTIINSLPAMFYLFEQTGKLLRWNENAESVTGYSREELAERTPLDFFDSSHRERVAAAIRQVLEQGQASIEAELLTKDRQHIPYLFFGRRILLREKACVVGMGVDISERHRIEQELRQAEERLRNYTSQLEGRVTERTAHLQQSLQSLEGLLYHVAHDLRAPLRAMASFTRILLEDYGQQLDERGCDYARRISTSAQFMDSLVQDLLAYGRLAHTTVNLHKVSLQSQVDAVLEQFSEEIRNKHAQIEVQRPLPQVQGNPLLLNQILLNLLGNALKFVPPNVSPHVRIHAESDGLVRLWVEDNGIGIKPEYHHRIFRVFERLHTANQYPGTGIGLAIVQKGVERMGGRVGVESAPGGGSRFWIELPTAE